MIKIVLLVQVELDAVGVGDILTIIELGDIEHSVRLTVDSIDTAGADFTSYNVTKIGEGNKGTVRDNKDSRVSFQSAVSVNSDYGVNTGFYGTQPAFATVTTALEFNGVDQGATNTDGYGIDIVFQKATISTDWELVAFNG